MDAWKQMVVSSLTADAYTLGLHWIYDTNKIQKIYSNSSPLFQVQGDSYHKGKTKGDFTHYGDQAMFLMDLLQSKGEFSLENFYPSYLNWANNYKGYIDHATKETVKHMNLGINQGYMSSELGGASRMAPVLYAYRNDASAAKKMVMMQTKATHNHALPIEISAYLCDVIFSIANGKPLMNSLEDNIKKASKDIQDLYDLGKNCTVESPVQAIVTLGQSCPSESAFPALVCLLHRYPDDYKVAMKFNVLAGGDSAARAMVLGMLYGIAEITHDEDWTKQVRQMSKIESFLQNK